MGTPYYLPKSVREHLAAKRNANARKRGRRKNWEASNKTLLDRLAQAQKDLKQYEAWEAKAIKREAEYLAKYGANHRYWVGRWTESIEDAKRKIAELNRIIGDRANGH